MFLKKNIFSLLCALLVMSHSSSKPISVSVERCLFMVVAVCWVGALMAFIRILFLTKKLKELVNKEQQEKEQEIESSKKLKAALEEELERIEAELKMQLNALEGPLTVDLDLKQLKVKEDEECGASFKEQLTARLEAQEEEQQRQKLEEEEQKIEEEKQRREKEDKIKVQEEEEQQRKKLEEEKQKIEEEKQRREKEEEIKAQEEQQRKKLEEEKQKIEEEKQRREKEEEIKAQEKQQRKKLEEENKKIEKEKQQKQKIENQKIEEEQKRKEKEDKIIVGSGDISERKEKINQDIEALDISGDAVVEIDVDEQNDCCVTAVGYENILNCLNIKQDAISKKLIISQDYYSFRGKNALKYIINVNKLNAITISGKVCIERIRSHMNKKITSFRSIIPPLSNVQVCDLLEQEYRKLPKLTIITKDGSIIRGLRDKKIEIKRDIELYSFDNSRVYLSEGFNLVVKIVDQAHVKTQLFDSIQMEARNNSTIGVDTCPSVRGNMYDKSKVVSRRIDDSPQARYWVYNVKQHFKKLEQY